MFTYCCTNFHLHVTSSAVVFLYFPPMFIYFYVRFPQKLINFHTFSHIFWLGFFHTCSPISHACSLILSMLTLFNNFHVIFIYFYKFHLCSLNFSLFFSAIFAYFFLGFGGDYFSIFAEFSFIFTYHQSFSIFSNKFSYPPIFTNFHLFSFIFTYFRLFSAIFTNFHLFSPHFTCFHLFSPIFTYFHLFSLIFTHSPIFTYFHQFSPIFTYCHLFSRIC